MIESEAVLYGMLVVIFSGILVTEIKQKWREVK